MQYSNHLAKQPQGKLLIAVHKATYMSLLFALFESINYNPLDYVTVLLAACIFRYYFGVGWKSVTLVRWKL